MQRISTSTAVKNLHGTGKNGWRNGNPATGVQATQFNAEWCNALQEEVANVIESQGITLNPNDNRQLQTAIARMANAAKTTLSNSVTSTSSVVAATSNAVKIAYDKAVEAEGKGLPVGAIVAFHWSIANPEGYLLCNGSAFSRETYADLYRVLGNRDRVPHLGRSDIGQTAYFPVDNIPNGWIAFDDIERLVTRTAYRELYDLLVTKYGSIAAVPKAADRYIRNNGNGLEVGATQEDELKSHSHRLPSQFVGFNGDTSIYDRSQSVVEPKPKMTLFNDSEINHDNGWILPKIDTPAATGGSENRPKTIVFKLCIKALNTFNDVRFWIKAFGSVSNVGSLDASRLAQDLQAVRAEKANQTDLRAVQTALNNKPNTSEFSYQKIGEFEVIKYPDGTMIQTYRYTPDGGRLANRDHWRLTFNWAVSFLNQPRIFTQFVNNEQTATGNYTNASIDTFVEIVAQETNNAKVVFNTYEQDHNGTRSFIDFLAIGRWK